MEVGSPKLVSLLCLYVVFCVPTLASTTVAPLVYNISKGQPEQAQPSDNLPIGPVVVKNVDIYSDDGREYTFLLMNRTSSLLSEAMEMLNEHKDLKERRWLKVFIHRLTTLATMLNDSTIRSSVNVQDMENSIPLMPNPQLTVKSVQKPKVNKAMPKYSKNSLGDVLPKIEVADLNQTFINPHQTTLSQNVKSKQPQVISVIHPQLITDAQPMTLNGKFHSSGDGRGHLVLHNKTSALLTEAMGMLNGVKNVKERRWMKDFILRLGTLAALMEESRNRNTSIHEVDNSVIGVPNSLSSLKASKDIPKHVENSPNKVLPKETVADNETATNPEMAESDDDELSRQLQKMHLRPFKKPVVYGNAVLYAKPLAETITAPPTAFSILSSLHDKSHRFHIEQEKAHILARLTEDISRLRRLGESKEGILKFLKLDNHSFADFTDPEFFLHQHRDLKNEPNEFEIAEDTQNDDNQSGHGISEIKKNELSISRVHANLRNQVMKTMPLPVPNSQHTPHFIPQQLDPRQPFNHPQFLNQRPVGLYPPRAYGPQPLQNRPQYLNRFYNMALRNNLPMHGPFESRLRDHPIQQQVYANRSPAPHFEQQYQSLDFFPSHPAYPVAPYASNHLFPMPRPHPFRYGDFHPPYPDLSFNQTQLSPAMPPYPFSHHQLPHNDPHLNDKMERQLRDGKIIVLSDSLVHTNFVPEGQGKEVADGNSTGHVITEVAGAGE